MTVLGAVSFGSIYIIPVYCAQIQGYNAQQIGYVVMWSGLPQLVLFPLMPRIMRLVDARLLVIIGTLFFRRQLLHQREPDARRRHGPTHPAATDAGDRPAAVHHPLVATIDRRSWRPRHGGCILAVDDDAQPGRLDRHRHPGHGHRATGELPFFRPGGCHNQQCRAHPAALATMAGAAMARVADMASAKMMALGQLALQVRREAYVSAYADAFWIVGVRPADQPVGGWHTAQARSPHRAHRGALKRRTASVSLGRILFRGYYHHEP